MTEPDVRKDPDQGLLDGIESDDGDGRGIGNTLGPDVSVDAERREIERQVFERRTFTDRAAEEHWTQPPGGEGGQGADAPRPDGLAGDNEQQGARMAHGKAQAGQGGAAPDPAREQGTLGSINETEGS